MKGSSEEFWVPIKSVAPGSLFDFQGEKLILVSVVISKRARGKALAIVTAEELRNQKIKRLSNLPAHKKVKVFSLSSKKQFKVISWRKERVISCSISDPTNILELFPDKIRKKYLYLSPGVTFRAVFFRKELIDIILPPTVELTVKEILAEVGDRRRRILTNTGLKLLCPAFVDIGDVIWVSSTEETYLSISKKK